MCKYMHTLLYARTHHMYSGIVIVIRNASLSRTAYITGGVPGDAGEHARRSENFSASCCVGVAITFSVKYT